MTDLRRRRRSPGHVRVTRGGYRAIHDDQPADLLQVWRDQLPDSARFTHLTSALARGWHLPAALTFQPVFVAVAPGSAQPRRAGLIASRPVMLEPIELWQGLPLAGATDTLAACARDLGLLDLVALLDSALHSRQCSVTEVQDACREHRRGAPALRRAISYADPNAESPWESLLRMLHVLSDVPVESQVVIGPYRGDLRIKGTRRLSEYDGAHHQDGRQQSLDRARDRALLRDGWERYGNTAYTVVREPMSILRDADRALGRRHDPRRLRPFLLALSDSCVTPSGRARLHRRWTPRAARTNIPDGSPESRMSPASPLCR